MAPCLKNAPPKKQRKKIQSTLTQTLSSLFLNLFFTSKPLDFLSESLILFLNLHVFWRWLSMQMHKINGNVRTSSDKYKPTKEALQGLPMDLPTRNVENGFPYGGPLRYSGRLSTTGLPTGTEMDTHISYRPQGRAGDFPTTSGPVVARSNTERLDRKRSNKYTHLPVNQVSSKYNHLDVSDSSSQQEWTRHLLNGPSYSKKEDKPQYKESTTVSSNTITKVAQ